MGLTRGDSFDPAYAHYELSATWRLLFSCSLLMHSNIIPNSNANICGQAADVRVIFIKPNCIWLHMLIYTSPQLIMVGNIKNILESHGIESWIKEAFQGAGMGEIPPQECWHELILVNNSQYEKAKHIVDEALKPSEHINISWKCPNCNEELEGQFTECWNCGSSRPEE